MLTGGHKFCFVSINKINMRLLESLQQVDRTTKAETFLTLFEDVWSNRASESLAAFILERSFTLVCRCLGK